MQQRYLTANTKVTVNNRIGTTVGIATFSSLTIKILLSGDTTAQDFPRADVELYVAPRKVKTLFKDVASTKSEKLMAKLLQATTHENVIKTALEALSLEDRKHFTVTHSPASATSKWTLLTPKDLLGGDKVPVLVAHTDLHPSLKHPTIDNLEYEDNLFTSPTGLGADDRAGIFAITELLQHISYMPFAVLFPDEEEVGLKGTHAFTTTSHFTDLDKYASMYISVDRRRSFSGKANLATYGKDNHALNKAVGLLLNREVVKGSSTDCRALSAASARKVPCFNLSCGYTKEHSVDETLYFKEAEETANDLIVLLSDSTIVNKSYTTDPVKTITYNHNAYLEMEDSVIVDGQWFEKEDIAELLELHLYCTGNKFSTKKNAFNEIVPEVTIGMTMRLNPSLVQGQMSGGQLVTREMFTTLKNDLWEVDDINAQLQLTLKGTKTTLTCMNIPQAWLEEAQDDEPIFEN